MDGLRLALIVAGIALVAVIYFVTARRRRIDREAGRFDRFDAWSDGERDPLVDPTGDAYDELHDGDAAADDVPPLPPGWVPSRPADVGSTSSGADDAAQAPARAIPSTAAVGRSAPAARARTPEAPEASAEAPRSPPVERSSAEPSPARSPGVSPPPPGAARRPAPSAFSSATEEDPVIEGLEAIAESLGQRDDEPVLGELPEMIAPARTPIASRGKGKREVPAPRSPSRTGGRRKPREEVQAELALEPPPGEPEMVIVLNVMATSGERFAGPELHAALEDVGLRFGAMQAYHHHQGEASLFTVLNAVSPGTLNPEEAEGLATPGIALVLGLPGPGTPLEAFETMHGVARALAERLGGRVCDATRSSLTRQAANHLREQIAEYGRRKRLPG